MLPAGATKRPPSSHSNKRPQITQRLHFGNGIVLELQTQPLLQRRLQLHSAQAVQMQILR